MSALAQPSLWDAPAVQAPGTNRATVVQELLDTLDLQPCPLCSFFKRDHEDMWEDALAVPTIVGGRDKRFRLVGPCEHMKPLFGSYESQTAAKLAWAAEVKRLAKLKKQRRAVLNECVSRVLAEQEAARQAELAKRTIPKS